VHADTPWCKQTARNAAVQHLRPQHAFINSQPVCLSACNTVQNHDHARTDACLVTRDLSFNRLTYVSDEVLIPLLNRADINMANNSLACCPSGAFCGSGSKVPVPCLMEVRHCLCDVDCLADSYPEIGCWKASCVSKSSGCVTCTYGMYVSMYVHIHAYIHGHTVTYIHTYIHTDRTDHTYHTIRTHANTQRTYMHACVRGSQVRNHLQYSSCI
jgi:hypothetical protein